MESQNHLPLQQLPLKGTGFFKTCFNGFNALAGVGILSIPFALSQGGWLSLILLFLLAVTFWYTGLLLQRCMDGNPQVKTYPDIGALAFGSKGRVAVSLFVYLELYFLAIEYLILEGDNLEKLFPNVGFRFGGMKIEGKKMFVPLSALIVLPTTWLDMGLLAYVSFGGVLTSAIILCSVAWIGAVDGVGFNEGEALLKFEGLPTTISLFTFCYCGHAVFPMLYSSMKDKTQFPKVLVVCFVSSTATFGTMAILGYLIYGGNTKSQITLNLPVQHICTKIAIMATVISPLTRYAAMTRPITCAIEDASSFCRSWIMSFFIRAVFVSSTAMVALTIPFFAYVVAFTGASLSLTSAILMPCFFYLKIHKGARRFGLESMVIYVIILMGACFALVGTYSSGKEIIKRLLLE